MSFPQLRPSVPSVAESWRRRRRKRRRWRIDLVFSVEAHSGKELRHFKYLCVSFSAQLLCSDRFIGKVRETQQENRDSCVCALWCNWVKLRWTHDLKFISLDLLLLSVSGLSSLSPSNKGEQCITRKRRLWFLWLNILSFKTKKNHVTRVRSIQISLFYFLWERWPVDLSVLFVKLLNRFWWRCIFRLYLCRCRSWRTVLQPTRLYSSCSRSEFIREIRSECCVFYIFFTFCLKCFFFLLFSVCLEVVMTD